MTKSTNRPSAEIINPGLGDIEKVRDILFGKYVESFEQRFALLEKRLEADVEQLKLRLNDKIDSMDDEVNKSVKRLDQQIDAEKSSRDSELNALQEMLNKAEATLRDSISLMEDQANQDLAAVRTNLEQSHKELLKHSESVQTSLTKQLEEQKQDLGQDKVGRQNLALMLDEVAVKLRGS